MKMKMKIRNFIIIALASVSLAAGQTVDGAVMQEIYDAVATPYKYGFVVKGENDVVVDSPSIFFHKGKWYMVYIALIDSDGGGLGYETRLASSFDLVTWNQEGVILSQGSGGWDDRQLAGYISLQDIEWGGSNELLTHDGKYWLSYLGGEVAGYEGKPMFIGIAWTENIENASEWERLAEPVISTNDPDNRAWEDITQYKSNIIFDPDTTLGYPYVMFYNAKGDKERIGMAVSEDMVQWTRHLDSWVLETETRITGDPQVVKIGDVWVMFYFNLANGASDWFACSYDLEHWTNWEGEPLITPTEPWDQTYAHKPWVINHYGVVYHFYCAVGDQGRHIALATSVDLRDSGLTSGCKDNTYLEYDPNVTLHIQDSCRVLAIGCMDPQYEEYDPMATVSDSAACITLDVSGRPLPARHFFGLSGSFLVVTAPFPGGYTVELTDTHGKARLKKALGAETNRIDVSGLPKGVYLAILRVRGLHYTEKIIFLP
jgi:predicted GH43/DUF377 family glycosyl hydrolase